MNAQPPDADWRLCTLPYDDVVEDQPREEVPVELADSQITFENAVRLTDDEIPGVALEPGGVQKREKTENKKSEGECPVNDDSARKPPQSHEYMLPRAGLAKTRERGAGTDHLIIQE